LHEGLRFAGQYEPELSEVNVHSSPNAVDAYERLGFQATGPQKLEHGISFIPMRLRTEKVDSG